MSTKDRGFASIGDRARQLAIASKGGKTAQRKGTGHQWTTEEARAAGKKGGAATQARKRAARGLVN